MDLDAIERDKKLVLVFINKGFDFSFLDVKLT